MKTMHERRLDNTVAAGDIGIGETVHVKTLMGDEIVCGEVVAANPFGMTVREGEDGSSSFFASELHLFSVQEPDAPVVVANDLSGLSPDERVAFKLKQMAEAEADAEDDEEDLEGDDDEKEVKEQPKKEKPKDKKDDKEPQDGESVDVDKLPDDIKDAIISADELGGERLNSVMSDVSDAALKALKRVGVKEEEIYALVAEIQKKISDVLAPNKEKKK